MKFAGSFEGFIPHHTKPPTYQNQPSDYRIKIRVTEDVDELMNELSNAYDEACEWYVKQGGKRSFFDAPWISNEDGSVTVRLNAKPKYEEFPFPVVDGQLKPLSEDLLLKEGTMVLVQAKPKFISPKAMKGGMRLVPQGMQVLKAVTTQGHDSGGFDIEKAFKKQKGFTQSKPVVEEPATVADEDEDF